MTTRYKVTSIERYHLYDGSDQNPNVIGCELVVSGDIDQDLANRALRETATRHPLTFSTLVNNRWWVADPASVALIQWEIVTEGGNDGEQADYRQIDPAVSPVRFLWKQLGDTVRLSFRAHHACLDGGGGLQFVLDWLLTYNRLFHDIEKPRSRETHPDLLHRRNHLRLLQKSFLGKLWLQPVALFGATKFLFRKVVPIDWSADKPNDSSRNDGQRTSDQSPLDFRLVEQSLDQQSVERLKQRAGELQVTLNELILHAVYMAIHDYRVHEGLHSKGEWVRMVIPISIRDFADRRLPATNRATIVQVDRNNRHFSDPKGLIGGLSRELGCIKQWNLEKTFLLAIRCFSVIPGFIRRSAEKDVCRATSVLTNLGAPLERMKLPREDGKVRSGNICVEDVGLIVPLRSQTPIGFAVLRYAEQQKFCLHFDPAQIEQKAAEQIMERTISWLGNFDW